MSDTTTPTDPPTVAGETGFVISLDWEADDMIRRLLDVLADATYAVSVTPHDGEPFDAMTGRNEAGDITFTPWDLAHDIPEPDTTPLVFDFESIDGVHAY